MPLLDQLKRGTDLEALALSFGWEKVAGSYTKKFPVLQKEDRKIFIKKSENTKKGFDVFACYHDESFRGTVIDFLMDHLGCDFRKARGKLLEINAKPEYKKTKEKSGAELNRNQLQNFISKCRVAARSRYLKSRGIESETLTCERFNGTVLKYYSLKAKKSLVIFPHRDRIGLTGWEARNEVFKGFAKNAIKSLWFSNTFTSDDTLVICESAIDALSYYQSHKPQRTRLCSVAGNMDYRQKELLKSAMTRVDKVLLAFDNGKGGDRLASIVSELSNADTIGHRPPPNFSDWNDYLRGVEMKRE